MCHVCSNLGHTLKLLVAILKLLPQMSANHIDGVMVGVLDCGRLLVQFRLVKLLCCLISPLSSIKKKELARVGCKAG